jgi:2-polyprenyl-3-methyl-5-hydroxy-6-metoxy-1,4-benzoquinol methylase
MEDPLIKTVEKKVGDYWGEFHSNKKPKLSWLESETVIKYINKRITGDEDGNWCELIRKNDNSKYKRALIVGCGTGGLERDLYKLGFFESCIGVDISEKSIELAIKYAESEGLDKLEYRKFNLERDDYADIGSVDLVVVAMAAHHIENLDYFYKNIYKILDNNNGLLVLNEYIGPNRFWHNDKVLNIINKLLASLSDKFKINYLVDGGGLRTEYIRTPIEHFLEHDPSEAICSEDILSKLNKKFNISEYKPYGGQINHMLLTGIVQNFDLDEHGKEILKVLMTFEEILEECNAINPDFALVLAKPKPRLKTYIDRIRYIFF